MTPKITNKTYLKYFILYGLPYGLVMLFWEYFESGEWDLKRFFFLTVFFGFIMSVFTVWQIENEISKRGLKVINPDEIDKLNNRPVIKNQSLENIETILKKSTLIPRTKIIMKSKELILKPSSIISNWGDPIHITALEDSNDFEIQAKRKILSPEVNYYINALNIKEIIGLIHNNDFNTVKD